MYRLEHLKTVIEYTAALIRRQSNGSLIWWAYSDGILENKPGLKYCLLLKITKCLSYAYEENISKLIFNYFTESSCGAFLYLLVIQILILN